MLSRWKSAADQMVHWRETESKLRDEVIAAIFTPSKDEGSETVEIVPGWKAKATKKLDYKLKNDEGQVEALAAILDDQTKKQLIRWKPELSVSAYKQLDEATQQLFNGCLTIKPGKASLEIIEEK